MPSTSPHSARPALVEARVQLERGDHDVPTQRLAVDDRPARRADLAQEELTQRDQILDEQVRLIFPGTIAGSCPRVAFSEEVSRERRRADVARPHTSLDPVGKDHEPAFPVGRHLDPVARAAKRARPADGAALRVGATSAGPGRGQRDECQAQDHESGQQPAHRCDGHRQSLCAAHSPWRKRDSPSCATEATSAPACVKTLPRTNARPPA